MRLEKIRDFKCPVCKKYGLHFYTKEGSGVYGDDLIKSIHHIWCLYCKLKINYAREKQKCQK